MRKFKYIVGRWYRVQPGHGSAIFSKGHRVKCIPWPDERANFGGMYGWFKDARGNEGALTRDEIRHVR